MPHSMRRRRHSICRHSTRDNKREVATSLLAPVTTADMLVTCPYDTRADFCASDPVVACATATAAETGAPDEACPPGMSANVSTCSRHANAVVQPLWRDVCVGVVHCLIVVLALLALLVLQAVMCTHPDETLLLPVLPSPGCPGLSSSLSHSWCVPGAELCCAVFLLHKTHPPDQACGLPYQHCKRLVTLVGIWCPNTFR